MSVIADNFGYLVFGQFPNGPLGGLALTLYLAVLIGIASFVVGALLASLAFTRFAAIGFASRVLIQCVRGIPSLTFLFWMYFLIPRLIKIDISPLMAATVALAIYHGAYIAEDLRGGIKSVAAGQWEAGRAQGLRTRQLLAHVIFPQAIRTVAPALVNRFVNLFMYTSIVSALGILEFTRAAILVNNRELVYPMQIFGFIGLTYFMIGFGISHVGRMLERRWSWAPKIGDQAVAT